MADWLPINLVGATYPHVVPVTVSDAVMLLDTASRVNVPASPYVVQPSRPAAAKSDVMDFPSKTETVKLSVPLKFAFGV